ncbi:MAG: 3-deoxy-D-manno-octulosonic acid transferase, partial [Opitutaceae bacterium]
VEAAALGLPILFGPNMTNFRAISRGLVSAGAAKIVSDADALVAESVALLADRKARAEMSARGRAWHASNRGAVERTVAMIRQEL